MNLKQMKMKKLKKDQRGITLIELVIAFAITGIITAAITMAVFQVFTMNTRTSNRMAAVSQVQHAGKLVSEDILKAQPAKIDDTPPDGKFLVLGWTAQNGAEHEVIYTLEAMPPSGLLKILWREHRINSVPSPTTKVAEYIDSDPDQTRYDWDGEVLTFKVTANVGGQSETREYEVMPRPGS